MKACYQNKSRSVAIVVGDSIFVSLRRELETRKEAI